MFDLPDPFGPTITLTPLPKVEAGAIGEGLEALDRERLQVHACDHPVTPAPRAWSAEAGRLLLGVLLAAPGAPAERLPASRAGLDRKAARVRRAVLAR